MPAPKVTPPESPEGDKQAPEINIVLPPGIKLFDGPQRGKQQEFKPAAYPIAPGVVRIDR